MIEILLKFIISVGGGLWLLTLDIKKPSYAIAQKPILKLDSQFLSV